MEIFLLLTLRMEIDTADIARDLIEANVVEAFETGSGNSPHTMIRNEEVFLPPHKDILSLSIVLVAEVRFLCLL